MGRKGLDLFFIHHGKRMYFAITGPAAGAL